MQISFKNIKTLSLRRRKELFYCRLSAEDSPRASIFQIPWVNIKFEGYTKLKNSISIVARAVVVVGLPFANIKDPELQERLKYLDNQVILNQKKTESNQETLNGRSYYENLCMKAVNQSIGRAIRHKNDYACAILIDKRFSDKNIQSKLSSWIQERIFNITDFKDLNKTLEQFFIINSISCTTKK